MRYTQRIKGLLFANPLRVLPVAFGSLIALGTALLMLPISSTDQQKISFVEALFTATSAVCVTGLTVVDTATAWTGFGKAVIMGLIQLGGLGIVTVVSVAILLVSDRIGMAHTRALAAEVGADTYTRISGLVRGVVLTTLSFELVFAVLLSTRFYFTYDYDVWTSVSHGVFHSISAWNNAGFALYSDSLMQFVNDWFISIAISIAVIMGGLGFPVLRAFTVHGARWKSWSLHAKLTITTSGALVLFGFVAFAVLEWSNQNTLGALSSTSRVHSAFFMSVQPRSGGFNSVDVNALSEESIFVSIGLMLIGGGSASTAGGIKVTTFALLAFVMWAEVRGDRDVHIFKKRVPEDIQRQALTVSLAGVGILAVATLAVMAAGDSSLGKSAFEAVSALSTGGLSVGIAGQNNALTDVILTVLMFVGRLGPVTLAASITLRSRPNLYRYPIDRPLIG
jgi:potassium uptake TrkH family protein